MRIAYFEAESGDDEKLRAAFPKANLTVVSHPLSEETVDAVEDAELMSVFVKSVVSDAVLSRMPKIKMIATRSTGYDHIDLSACEKRHITVSNVPTYGENTVAEHAFALILALSRKIFQSYERTERMDFDRDGLRGFDLFGRTLGVVGTGHIGRHIIRIGRGFAMRVLAYDARQDPRLPAELGFEYARDLDDLLARSDVVTLHVPLLPETTHLINKKNIPHIKRGAILVNTSRGQIVETEAILWALEQGILGGAGLDVLEEENDTYEWAEALKKGSSKRENIEMILRNHILVARDDVIITPHNAYNSIEAVQRIFDTTVGNMRGFVSGHPINVVRSKEA